MTELWWIFLLIVAVMAALKFLGTNGLDRALKVVRANGSVAAVVTVIEEAPEGKRATMWDQAIGTLWREYRREEAFELMMEGAIRSEAPIVQYWLRNAMEVEPEMASLKFNQEFLETYFRPSVAAKCGRCGCSK